MEFVWKKGLKVWYVPEGFYSSTQAHELTVRTVGKVWITFEEDEHSHAMRTDGQMYERRSGANYPRGKLWTSEADYKRVKGTKKMWESLAILLYGTRSQVPPGITLERIQEACKTLGIMGSLVPPGLAFIPPETPAEMMARVRTEKRQA